MSTERMGVVTRLPTSCTEVVQQHRGPGRYPKVIGQLRDAREKRSSGELKKTQGQQLEISKRKAQWFDALQYLEYVEGKLYALGSEPPNHPRARVVK